MFKIAILFFYTFFKLSRLPELCRKTRTVRRRKQTFQKETSRLSGETHFTMQCWTSQSSLMFRVGLQFFCLLSENARSFLSDRQIRCHKSIMKCVDYITRLHNNLFVEKKFKYSFVNLVYERSNWDQPRVETWRKISIPGIFIDSNKNKPDSMLNI